MWLVSFHNKYQSEKNEKTQQAGGDDSGCDGGDGDDDPDLRVDQVEHIHNVLLDKGGGGGSEGDDGHPWELLLKTSQLQEVRSVLMIFAVLTI